MGKTEFINEDFLLETDAARALYHEHAESLPIIDFHNHLPAGQIAADQRWDNLCQVWLAGDHYKWRAMRGHGVAERYCTGNAPDWEKFEKWADTVPCLLRNPLYHWTHLELKRHFGISDRLLSPATARSIWEEANERIRDPAFSCRSLLRKAGVVLLCTTDDPIDSLEHHRAIAADKSFDVQVLPTWRPDKAMDLRDPAVFNQWTDRLAAVAQIDIQDWTSFMQALRKRHAAFHAAGCRLSDHGMETVPTGECTGAEVARIFQCVRGGRPVSPEDTASFQAAMLYEFGCMNAERGWTQQFHIGVIRNNNSRQFAALGPDTGFDSMSDLPVARPLLGLFDRLERAGRLAKTIVYNLNPRDNALLVSTLGNFQDGSVPGKMQYGSAWWFLDQIDGMERQMDDLSQMGLLSHFVGMVTDSRSFLSYPRHEYFRRILCNLLGRDMTRGRLPADMDLVARLVRDVCYGNAARYFGFHVKLFDS